MAAKDATIAELARGLRARRTSALSVTESCLARIADVDPVVNAFITVFERQALEQARDADLEIGAGRYRGPLHGVPVSLKDLFDLQGTPTTAGSRVTQGRVAAGDAPVVTRLRRAGAIIIGKTNLHEFALGTTNEDSAYGPVTHPLDPARSPGGSSGGSAASVLAGMAYASVGTDTGGSIRIPAAACGLVGLKPRFGTVTTEGTVPLSSTLDHIGPLCRSVEDAGIVYGVLRGAPAPEPKPVLRPGGLRLGVLRGYFTERLDPEVRRAFDAACGRLEAAGVTLEDATIEHARDASAIYVHIVLSEAAAYHATSLDRRPEAYTRNVRLRLEMGRYILAEDYVRALRGRHVLGTEVDAALQGRNGLLLPALAVPATRLGAETVDIEGTDESVRNITLRLTQLFNLTGHAAISVPCGSTIDGLPVGAQLVADQTETLLDVAGALEPFLTTP